MKLHRDTTIRSEIMHSVKEFIYDLLTIAAMLAIFRVSMWTLDWIEKILR